MTTTTARDVKCNHCGLAFMTRVGVVASPICGYCRKAGHTTSIYGCDKCRQQLEKDLRHDELQKIVDNDRLDIGFFDND